MSEQVSKATSLEEMMKGSGYPLEAMAFVQEGLSYTVESLHGAESAQLKWLYNWMNSDNRQIDYDELCRRYHEGKLPVKGRHVVDELGGPERINRHVSGEDLCWGLRDLAVKRWGRMARTVLRRWSITETLDFGKIVFLMVDNKVLQKQPDDRLDDFEHVFEFSTVFDQAYEIPVRDLRLDD